MINGTSQIDGCGVCGGDGTSCGFKVKSLRPSIIPNAGSPTIYARGAGFSSLTFLLYIVHNIIPSSISSSQVAYFQAPFIDLQNKPELTTNFIFRQGDIFFKEPVTIFDLEIHKISDYSPHSVAVGSTARLVFTLSTMALNVTNGACLFKDAESTVLITPLIYLSNITLGCDTHKSQTASGQVQIKVLYDLPDLVTWDSNLSLLSNGDMIITFIAQPPSALNAYYVDTGTSIEIQFDKPCRGPDIILDSSSEFDIFTLNQCSDYFLQQDSNAMYDKKLDHPIIMY